MQEKEAFRQEMLEESKEREALMAVQLRREVCVTISLVQ